MEVIISDRGNVLTFPVESIFVDASINLQYSQSTSSYVVYNKLRDLGIKCYHVGKNAPHGPYVAVYLAENKDTKILIQ